MAYRKRMSRKHSRKSFRKFSGKHKKNRPHKTMRGGFRL